MIYYNLANMGFNRVKQRYKISTSLIKPSSGQHVLLIRLSVHGCEWGIGSV